MDTLTSATSEAYSAAFSEGFRKGAQNVSTMDIVVLVLLALLVLYLLARTFQKECRTVCKRVCPETQEHMVDLRANVCTISGTNINYVDADTGKQEAVTLDKPDIENKGDIITSMNKKIKNVVSITHLNNGTAIENAVGSVFGSTWCPSIDAYVSTLGKLLADESGQPLTIEGKTHKLEEFVRIPAEMLKPAADLNKCGTIFNRKTCTFTVPRQWTSTGTVKEFTMPVSYLLDENGNYKIKHFMYNYN